MVCLVKGRDTRPCVSARLATTTDERGRSSLPISIERQIKRKMLQPLCGLWPFLSEGIQDPSQILGYRAQGRSMAVLLHMDKLGLGLIHERTGSGNRRSQ